LTGTRLEVRTENLKKKIEAIKAILDCTDKQEGIPKNFLYVIGRNMGTCCKTETKKILDPNLEKVETGNPAPKTPTTNTSVIQPIPNQEPKTI
jgi:hypothetical protein